MQLVVKRTFLSFEPETRTLKKSSSWPQLLQGATSDVHLEDDAMQQKDRERADSFSTAASIAPPSSPEGRASGTETPAIRSADSLPDVPTPTVKEEPKKQLLQSPQQLPWQPASWTETVYEPAEDEVAWQAGPTMPTQSYHWNGFAPQTPSLGYDFYGSSLYCSNYAANCSDFYNSSCNADYAVSYGPSYSPNYSPSYSPSCNPNWDGNYTANYSVGVYGGSYGHSSNATYTNTGYYNYGADCALQSSWQMNAVSPQQPSFAEWMPATYAVQQ